jgi:hypothetical protein
MVFFSLDEIASLKRNHAKVIQAARHIQASWN